MRIFCSLVILLFGFSAVAADRVNTRMELPAELRKYCSNPDGSCVQCSISMCGYAQNVPSAYTLLWDTQYGPAVRGGSWPERVAGYCESRGIKAYNVTGSGTTKEFMKWAAKTGRYAAIGAGGNHFQTLYGWDNKNTDDPRDDTWYVCNNNSTSKIDEYTNSGFDRLHAASGPWVVVLDAPPPPMIPQYKKWW